MMFLVLFDDHVFSTRIVSSGFPSKIQVSTCIASMLKSGFDGKALEICFKPRVPLENKIAPHSLLYVDGFSRGVWLSWVACDCSFCADFQGKRGSEFSTVLYQNTLGASCGVWLSWVACDCSFCADFQGKRGKEFSTVLYQNTLGASSYLFPFVASILCKPDLPWSQHHDIGSTK